MNQYDYLAALQQFDFTDTQMQIAMELPGFSMTCASVVAILRLIIQVKRIPKMEGLLHVAKLVALLDAPRNGIFSEEDIEAFFDPLLI